MTRALALLCLIASLSADTGPVFEAADVHATVVKGNNQYMRRVATRAGRYELRTATMVDLISAAYAVDADKVLGGPSWLEYDVFDVIAKAPPSATEDEKKAMLKALLADRFQLVAHTDTKPMPAFALTAGKKPSLKPADDSGETGCKFSMENAGPPPPPPPPVAGGTATAQPTIRIPTFLYTCRNIGMEAFAAQMRDMVMAQQELNNNPVVDRTELKGSYDFTLKYSFSGMRAFAGPDATSISLTEAIEKQLGLKLEPVKVPLPVLIVDSVNRVPTINPPGVAEKLKTAPEPTEFEVADIKPSDPEQRGMRFNIQPGGRVNLSGVNLKFLIQQAWGISDEMLVGAPKWMDTDRFDIVAKAPSTAAPPDQGAGPGPRNGPDIDIDTVWTMMRSLLAERFKLATHEESQTLSAYTLMPGKPKMKKADPESRTHYKEGPAPDAKDPRKANPALSRLVSCQNMTMDQFAAKLQGIAPGYIHSPVLNSTGLEGGWDFTLSFSPAGMGNILAAGRGGRGGGDAATGDASDPTVAVTLSEAIEKQMGLKLELQKRPVKVLVIDHIEQKPVDN